MSTIGQAIGIPEDRPADVRDGVADILPVDQKAEQLEHYRILQEADNDLKIASRHALAGGLKILRELDDYDPQFHARMAEVAATLIDTSIKGVKARQDGAQNDQKIRVAAGKNAPPGSVSNTQINNIFSGDRNAMLKMLRDTQADSPINPSEFPAAKEDIDQ